MSGSPRVLAILFGLVGDTLMRLPALRALRAQRPGLELTAVCDPIMARLLAGDRLFDHVIPWPRDRGARAQWRALRGLRARRYDVALDFYFGSRSPWIARVSGAPRRIGPARGNTARRLLTDPIPWPWPADRHMVDRFSDLVRPLGVTSLERTWKVALHPTVRARMRSIVDPVVGRIDAHRDLILVAGAGDVSKRLDETIEEAWVRARVAEGRRVLLVADRRDPSRGRDLLRRAGVEALPPLDLPELAAAFAEGALVASPDSGPLHLALGTAPRVLTWYLSTDPRIHHATRDGHRWLYEEVCPYQPCDTRSKHLCQLECRSSISVDALEEATRALLDGPGWQREEIPARDPGALLEEAS